VVVSCAGMDAAALADYVLALAPFLAPSYRFAHLSPSGSGVATWAGVIIGCGSWQLYRRSASILFLGIPPVPNSSPQAPRATTRRTYTARRALYSRTPAKHLLGGLLARRRAAPACSCCAAHAPTTLCRACCCCRETNRLFERSYRHRHLVLLAPVTTTAGSFTHADG